MISPPPLAESTSPAAPSPGESSRRKTGCIIGGCGCAILLAFVLAGGLYFVFQESRLEEPTAGSSEVSSRSELRRELNIVSGQTVPDEAWPKRVGDYFYTDSTVAPDDRYDDELGSAVYFSEAQNTEISVTIFPYGSSADYIRRIESLREDTSTTIDLATEDSSKMTAYFDPKEPHRQFYWSAFAKHVAYFEIKNLDKKTRDDLKFANGLVDIQIAISNSALIRPDFDSYNNAERTLSPPLGPDSQEEIVWPDFGTMGDGYALVEEGNDFPERLSDFEGSGIRITAPHPDAEVTVPIDLFFIPVEESGEVEATFSQIRDALTDPRGLLRYDGYIEIPLRDPDGEPAISILIQFVSGSGDGNLYSLTVFNRGVLLSVLAEQTEDRAGTTLLSIENEKDSPIRRLILFWMSRFADDRAGATEEPGAEAGSGTVASADTLDYPFEFSFDPSIERTLGIGSATAVGKKDWPLEIGEYQFSGPTYTEGDLYISQIGGGIYESDSTEIFAVVFPTEDISAYQQLVNATYADYYPADDAYSAIEQYCAIFYESENPQVQFAFRPFAGYCYFLTIKHLDGEAWSDPQIDTFADFFVSMTTSAARLPLESADPTFGLERKLPFPVGPEIGAEVDWSGIELETFTLTLSDPRAPLSAPFAGLGGSEARVVMMSPAHAERDDVSVGFIPVQKEESPEEAFLRVIARTTGSDGRVARRFGFDIDLTRDEEPVSSIYSQYLIYKDRLVTLTTFKNGILFTTSNLESRIRTAASDDTHDKLFDLIIGLAIVWSDQNL